jgi:hypothetical protein
MPVFIVEQFMDERGPGSPSYIFECVLIRSRGHLFQIIGSRDGVEVDDAASRRGAVEVSYARAYDQSEEVEPYH